MAATPRPRPPAPSGSSARPRPAPAGVPQGPLATVLAKFDGVRRSGAGWMARCPAHEDRQASLSLSSGTDGRALLHCHAGCATAAVLAAAGLKAADLFEPRPRPLSEAPASARAAARPTPARYLILDTEGETVAIHVRQETAAGKRMAWRLPDGTVGLGGRKVAELPLYGAHEAAEWHPLKPIVVAEGEKATEALWVAGVQAVGTVTGASSSPSPESLEILRGRHVVLWPDNDDPGREHMDRLADALAPLVLSLRRISWPEAPTHGDAADCEPARIAQLLSEAQWLTEPLPLPAALADIPQPADPDAFLIEGFIRPGTTIMLAGPPGSAKSWAARLLALVAGIGLRSYLDHYAVNQPMRVLVIDEDNGPNEEWRREEALMRFLQLNRADLTHVYRLSLEGVQLDQERWQRWLRGLIESLALDLVILDPISEMHGGEELRKDPAFRSMLAFLKKLKIDYPRLATVLVHHTRKRPGNERDAQSTLDDVRGQWGQTPDVVAILRSLGERRSRWELFKRVPHSALILEQEEGGGLMAVADQTTGPSRRATTDGRVLGAIQSGARTAEEIRIGTGLSKAGVFKALGRLHQAGLVSQRAPYLLLRDSDDPLEGSDVAYE